MKNIEQKRIHLADLIPAEFNSRVHYSESDLKDLANSIRENGILVSLVVRKHPTRKGQFEIISGFRRYKAGIAAGAKDAPCDIKEMDDQEAFEVMLIENLHREDIHPMDEAVSFSKLGETKTAEQIAAKIHKSKSYVLKRLKLNELITEVKELFYDGKVRFTQAIQIARLQKHDQERVLRECMRNRVIEGGKMEKFLAPEQDIRTFVDEKISQDLKNSPFDLDSTTLMPKAGSCSACPKRTKNQVDLFDQATKADKCMDPGCFKKKVEAHVHLAEKSMVQKGHERVIIAEQSNDGNRVMIGNQKVPLVKKSEVPGAIPVVINKIEWSSAQDQKKIGSVVYVHPDFEMGETKQKTKPSAKLNQAQSTHDAAAQKKREAFRAHLLELIFCKLTMAKKGKPLQAETLPEFLFNQVYNCMVEFNNLEGEYALAKLYNCTGMDTTKPGEDDETRYNKSNVAGKELRAHLYKLPLSNFAILMIAADDACTRNTDVTKTELLHQIATHLKLDPYGQKKAFSKDYDESLFFATDKNKYPAAEKPKGKGLAALLPDATKNNGLAAFPKGKKAKQNA